MLPEGSAIRADNAHAPAAQLCGFSCQLKLDIPASQTLLLAQPILQSRDKKAIVVVTDQQAQATSVHLLILQHGKCCLNTANCQHSWRVAVDSAAFDGQTRCLALLRKQDSTVLVCTMDAAFMQLRPDVPIPLEYLPQLSAIQLITGRRVRNHTAASLCAC